MLKYLMHNFTSKSKCFAAYYIYLVKKLQTSTHQLLVHKFLNTMEEEARTICWLELWEFVGLQSSFMCYAGCREFSRCSKCFSVIFCYSSFFWPLGGLSRTNVITPTEPHNTDIRHSNRTKAKILKNPVPVPGVTNQIRAIHRFPAQHDF